MWIQNLQDCTRSPRHHAFTLSLSLQGRMPSHVPVASPTVVIISSPSPVQEPALFRPKNCG